MLLFEICIHLEFHMYHLVNTQIMMGSNLLARLVQLVVLQLPWSLLVYEWIWVPHIGWQSPQLSIKHQARDLKLSQLGPKSCQYFLLEDWIAPIQHIHILFYLLMSFAKKLLGECSIDIHSCLIKTWFLLLFLSCVMFPWVEYFKYMIDIHI